MQLHNLSKDTTETNQQERVSLINANAKSAAARAAATLAKLRRDCRFWVDHFVRPLKFTIHVRAHTPQPANFFLISTQSLSLWKISHKNTVNSTAFASCHTSKQLWLRYTKIMIHHRCFLKAFGQIEFCVALMSFLRETENWKLE